MKAQFLLSPIVLFSSKFINYIQEFFSLLKNTMIDIVALHERVDRSVNKAFTEWELYDDTERRPDFEQHECDRLENVFRELLAEYSEVKKEYEAYMKLQRESAGESAAVEANEDEESGDLFDDGDNPWDFIPPRRSEPRPDVNGSMWGTGRTVGRFNVSYRPSLYVPSA